MAFRFRLESVLKLRKQKREERQKLVAQALEAVRVLETQKAEIRNERFENRQMLAEFATRSPINVDALARISRHDALLVGQENALVSQIEQVEVEVARRRADLVEANRDVMVVEKLRDRAIRNYEAAVEAKDRVLADEIALRQWRRHAESQ